MSKRKTRTGLSRADMINLKKLTGLDALEIRLFRRFHIWTDEQKTMFKFMIDANVREIDIWSQRRNREMQTKAVKEGKPP